MWYEKSGKDADVVLSTQVSIMRNIKGFQFPSKMSDADRENAMGMMRQASGNMGFNFIRCDEMDENAKKDLFNQYFCKYNFLNDNKKTAFLLGKEDGLGVTLNDKEHMAIMSFAPGDDVVTAYKAAEAVAEKFEKEMEIAYSDKMGFLTSDIRFVGTGLMISFLVALPGIEKTAGALAILSKRVEKYDWTIKPIMQVDGNKENGMYEITCIATLGVSESEVVTRAQKVISDTVKLERSCRVNIYKKKAAIIEDQFYRSYALLKYARRMETVEAISLLNWLRLGRGQIKNSEADIDWDKLNMITHRVRRDYMAVDSKGKRNPSIAADRAAGIRKALSEESERG